MTPVLYDVSELAEILGVSTKTVRRKIGAGEIGHLRIGRGIRISEEQLRQYLAASEVASTGVLLK